MRADFLSKLLAKEVYFRIYIASYKYKDGWQTRDAIHINFDESPTPPPDQILPKKSRKYNAPTVSTYSYLNTPVNRINGTLFQLVRADFLSKLLAKEVYFRIYIASYKYKDGWQTRDAIHINFDESPTPPPDQILPKKSRKYNAPTVSTYSYLNTPVNRINGKNN